MDDKVPEVPQELVEMVAGIDRALGLKHASAGGLAAAAWIAGYKRGLAEARADASFAPALAAHNRTAGDSIQQRREEQA